MCQLSLDTTSAFEEELIAGFAKVCQPLTRGHARSQHQAPHVTGLA